MGLKDVKPRQGDGQPPIFYYPVKLLMPLPSPVQEVGLREGHQYPFSRNQRLWMKVPLHLSTDGVVL